MPADWLDSLTTHVQHEWDKRGLAILLSRVPSLFEEDGFDPEDILQGRKLRPFLENETAGRFKVLQSEDHKIWGILPADASIAEPYSRYFPRSSGERPIRFAPAAWKAFTVPIPEGKRRLLFDEPSIAFQDCAPDDSFSNGYEIERRFVMVPEKTEDSDVHQATILSSIASWAAEQSVDPARFALGRKRAPVTKPAKAATARGSAAETALDQFLALLQPGELTRIALPLDVVARLQSVKSTPEA